MGGGHVWKDIYALLIRMSSILWVRVILAICIFKIKRDRFTATSHYLIVLGIAGGIKTR
jgi:hypothetical protein